ncbi:hypothetical protein HCJ76_00710 [Streptomyces sp. MC1]|uniref:hypothetical protein n=1 Tax=Streptomyces sp. MC1 TaxID=295105 RepID=UPI0018C8FBC8|nr:hypothetical protein [Streptomyces sp. MC1]MBG7696653.1 hypothetical protein [Streptomyces sp. MC1]
MHAADSLADISEMAQRGHPGGQDSVRHMAAESKCPSHQAEHRRTILIVDYVGLRSEPPLTALRLEDHGFRMVEVLRPPYVRAFDAAGYASALLEPHMHLSTEVAAVATYCMAGSIAQEVAARLSSPHYNVPLVVLDGEPSTGEAIRDQWGIALRRIAQMVGADVVDCVTRALSDDELLARPCEIAREIHGSMTSIGAQQSHDIERPSMAKDVEIFADWFSDWLVYLIAAHNAQWPHWGGDVLQLVSESHSAADWVGSRSEEVVEISTDRDGLVLDPGAKAALLSFLAERISDGRV